MRAKALNRCVIVTGVGSHYRKVLLWVEKGNGGKNKNINSVTNVIITAKHMELAIYGKEDKNLESDGNQQQHMQIIFWPDHRRKITFSSLKMQYCNMLVILLRHKKNSFISGKYSYSCKCMSWTEISISFPCLGLSLVTARGRLPGNLFSNYICYGTNKLYIMFKL